MPLLRHLRGRRGGGLLHGVAAAAAVPLHAAAAVVPLLQHVVRRSPGAVASSVLTVRRLVVGLEAEAVSVIDARRVGHRGRRRAGRVGHGT